VNRHKTLILRAKVPDGRGSFEGIIEFNPEKGDLDGERIANWVNLPARVPLGFAHLYNDPEAKVGIANVLQTDEQHLKVLGQLDIAGTNFLAKSVHERMLLPADDPRALADLSVGFHADGETTTDPNGVVVLHNAFLDEVSVCYQGAQATSISNVKSLPNRGFISAGPMPVELDILTEDGIRAHLASAHDYKAPNVGTSVRNQMSRLHQNLHGQRDVGHTHSAADALVQELRAEQLAAQEEKAAQAQWEADMKARAEHLVAVPLADELAQDKYDHERWVQEREAIAAERKAEAIRQDALDAERRAAARGDVRTYAP